MADIAEMPAPAPAVESAEDLLDARPLKVEARELKEFGRTVYFRELSAAGIDLFLGLTEKEAKFTRREIIELLRQTICDSKGNLLFAGEGGDRQLEQLHWKGIEEAFMAAMEVLGMTRDKVESKKKS